MSGRLYEATPKQVAPLLDDPLFRDLLADEVRTHIAKYNLTGNGVFVWRAWRVARLLGDMTPDMMKLFAPYLDECAERLLYAETPVAVAQAIRCSNPLAATGEGVKSAEKQESDYWLLVEYRFLTQRRTKPLKNAPACRKLGQPRGKSGGAIYQRLLRIMRIGQYATRGRKRGS